MRTVEIVSASGRARIFRRSFRQRPFCAGVPALKGWAPIVAALEHGDQTVLLRKGGIREPTFKPAAATFLLFPTAFHTSAQLLNPAAAEKYRWQCEDDPKIRGQLSLTCCAEVTGAWTTTDANVLAALRPLHVYSDDFLDARLRWRPAQPITILELRAYRLPEAVVLLSKEEYWGCFSWVDLDLAESPQQLRAGAQPALSAAAFAAEQQELRGCLAELTDLTKIAVPF